MMGIKAKMNNTEMTSKISCLVLTIKRLMPSYLDGWVKWRKVAKEIDGTEDSEPIWSGLAQLETYADLFAISRNAVKLSEAGILYADNLLPEELSEVQLIANGVRQYASRLNPIWLPIEGISKIAQVGTKYVHAVYVNIDDNAIPSETPVEFFPDGGGPTHGKVVGQEPDGGVLYILFDRKISDVELPGRLRIDQGYLLSQLANQISNLPTLPPLIKPLFNNTKQVTLPIADCNSVNVAVALSNLPTPWSRLLWGPPGAGKTYALGYLITQLIHNEPDGNILIVAPSNRAVDVVVEELLNQINETDLKFLLNDRKLLRFGYPRKPRIIECPEILGPTDLDELNREVERLSKRISMAEQEGNSDANLAILRAQMLAAQENIKSAVSNHVKQCGVVATTVTLAYMPTSPINKTQWSTVVVDESTMVTPAMCTYLASLARTRLLFAGDPRQLGPVYDNGPMATPEDYEWMGRDIFDKSGVSSGQAEERHISVADARLARITSQRRCASEIWSKVERLYLEVDNNADETKLQKLIALPPCSGKSVIFLDTAGNGKCEIMHNSWQNQFNAELAMEVALTIASEASQNISIAIVSPYRAQVNLINKWIRQEQKAERSPYRDYAIDCGTVHQFQGSAADVVIFDMVDSVNRNNIGYLLRGDTGLRLINVAITRARAKFIILGDKEWCRGAFTRSQNSLLWDLVLGTEKGELLKVAPRKEIIAKSIGPLTESPIEQNLYEALLRYNELRQVVPQHVIYDDHGVPISRADFAFPEMKYALYCDGKQWHLNQNQWQRDWRQRNKLTELGWIFSVFTGSDIYRNPIGCANQVLQTYRSRRRVA